MMASTSKGKHCRIRELPTGVTGAILDAKEEADVVEAGAAEVADAVDDDIGMDIDIDAAFDADPVGEEGALVDVAGSKVVSEPKLAVSPLAF